MIAGNINNSEIENSSDDNMNQDNEWLQQLNGTLPFKKKPALKIQIPKYEIQTSSKQKRGIGNV